VCGVVLINKYILLIKNFVRTAKVEGLSIAFRKFRCYVRGKGATARLSKLDSVAIKKKYLSRHYDGLIRYASEYDGVPPVILPPTIDWNVPLHQRMHHLASSLPANGIPYIFCTPRMRDSIRGNEITSGGCVLTDRWDLAYLLEGKKIFHLYSTDLCHSYGYFDKYENICREIDKGNGFIYDYVDEIHEDISKTEVSDDIIKRHVKMLEDERVLVTATADTLYDEVLKYRSGNCLKITNGVNLSDFKIQRDISDVPSELLDIVGKNRRIIGYYGSLAKWMDYELLMKIAEMRPEYEIILIGWKYDNSSDLVDFSKCNNIHIIGPVTYRDLSKYACWFDVSIIPFLVNEITKSTSPLKLFEYMALGHPIVTTDMDECRKYRSVLVSKTHEDFIENLDRALSMGSDEEYRKILSNEASENSWQRKASDLSELIKLTL
jgi:teichuronic acid biosynthesis glycosyltransferase TuaH